MAYVIKPRKSSVKLTLPITATLKDGRTTLELDYIKEEEHEVVRAMLNEVIEEGMTYPQREVLDPQEFREYFLKADAFVARLVEGGESPYEVVGTFYIKPNFPGRCDHICNGGFIVKPAYRQLGIGRAMAEHFLDFARRLGYRAAMFNLVFATNLPSLRLWRSLGFKEIGIVPRAGELANGRFVDAHQFYYDLTGATENTAQ
ncbi:N-acetyltransferase aca1 [Balamuthia mandrillaris]